MAKTSAQIQKQIEKLQQQAAALRAKEIAGVVERIRVAIEHYGLQPSDLFGPSAKPAAGKRRRVAKAQAAASPKAPRPIKFRDDAGHSWTGVGKRPRWYLDALAAGKTVEDLLVKPA